MYAMRKGDLKSFTPDSESVCRINDGNTNAYLREGRFIEKFLKKIEPRYNTALANLIEDKIDDETIFTIAGFVAYVIGCSPAGMRIFSVMLRGIVEAQAVLAEKRGMLPQPPKELGGAPLADLLRDRDIEIVVDPKYPQALGITTILRQVAAFGNFKWDILLNRFDDSPFFTSDFPVATEPTKDSWVNNRIVPLAPRLAVRIRPDRAIDRECADFSFSNFDYRRREISRNELVEINRLIVRCAEDVVFYRDNTDWVQRFIAKNRHYRVESIERKVSTDNGFRLFWTERIVAKRQDS